MAFPSQSHGGSPLKLYQWLTCNTVCVSSAGSKAVTGKDSWQSLHRTLSSLTLGLTSNTDCISAAVEILPPVQQFISVKSSDWQRLLATPAQDLVILIQVLTSNTDCISSVMEILLPLQECIRVNSSDWQRLLTYTKSEQRYLV